MPDDKPIRVAIVDDHQSVQLGVIAALTTTSDRVRVVGAFYDVIALLEEQPPADVVLLDLWMDDTGKQLATEHIAALRALGYAVVLHTAAQAPAILRQALAAGATGLVLKADGLRPLLPVIEEAASGQFACSSQLADALLNDDTLVARLTPRELDVLECVRDGLRQHDVALRLHVSRDRVKQVLRDVAQKYATLGRNAPNAIAAVQQATRDGYLR
jgi:DNA-binding NarL/FixJ family response regulator